MFEGGYREVTLLPVDDLGGDYASRRLFQDALAAIFQLEFRRAGSGELDEIVVEKGYAGF